VARRFRRPAPRTPEFPPWDRGECLKCAQPVRKAFLTPTDAVEVGMRPAPLGDRRADIACTVMDQKLVARISNRPEVGETMWIRHQVVCSEIPRPTQLPLPTEEP
jgi:hypothetical protein